MFTYKATFTCIESRKRREDELWPVCVECPTSWRKAERVCLCESRRRDVKYLVIWLRLLSNALSCCQKASTLSNLSAGVTDFAEDIHLLLPV